MEDVCSSACLYNFFEIFCAIQWYWHINWMIANMVKEITWSGKEQLICLIMVVQREKLWFDIYIVMYLCYDINVVSHLEDFAFSIRLEFLIGWLNVPIPRFLIEFMIFMVLVLMYQYLDFWLDDLMLVIKLVANFLSLDEWCFWEVYNKWLCIFTCYTFDWLDYWFTCN